MRKFHSGLRRFCAVIIGLVFFSAGLLKIMDPVGTRLIVDSYLKFMHLSWASGLSGPLGILLSLAETVTGIALVSGVWRKTVAVVTLSILGAFTLLTVALLIFNPEMDCGCFGEAVHLTHLESLVKNIILFALASVAFIPLDDGYGPRKPKFAGFAFATIASLLFAIYSNTHLPLADFTAFSVGDELFRPWEADAGQGGQDASALLLLRDDSGQYVDYMAAEGAVLAISVYDPGKLTDASWSKVEACVNEAFAAGVRPMILVASTDEIPLGLREFALSSDRKTLLTLNRSNGGATYMDSGQIVAKWALGQIPDHLCLDELSCQEPQEHALGTVMRGRLAFEALLLGSVAVMLLL